MTPHSYGAPVPAVTAAGTGKPPTRDQVREWTGAAKSSISDEQLQLVVDAEVYDQAQVCRVCPYTPNLYQAILRRCARHLAARGIPLGMTSGEAEYGPARLATFDAEVERIEGPSRIAVTG